MTFLSEQVRFYYRDYPMFSLWSNKMGNLFLPIEKEDEYGLISKVYFLMKRLNQPYRELLSMDSITLNAMFDMEMKLLEEEQKSNSKK